MGTKTKRLTLPREGGPCCTLWTEPGAGERAAIIALYLPDEWRQAIGLNAAALGRIDPAMRTSLAIAAWRPGMRLEGYDITRALEALRRVGVIEDPQARSRTKWKPEGLPAWYGDIPKAVLFVIARQMGAALRGTCDDLEAGQQAILDEWAAQHDAGCVPQRPPR